MEVTLRLRKIEGKGSSMFWPTELATIRFRGSLEDLKLLIKRLEGTISETPYVAWKVE